jgi:hypothetical protein
MTVEPTALDRFMAGRANAMVFVGLVGVAVFAWVGAGAVSAPWQLDESSPTVMSSTAKCDVRLGAQYEIRIDGEPYGSCGGATNKCAEVEAVAIAYDADDPSQCRVASAVDGLGRYESTLLLLGFGLSLAGVAGVGSLLSQRAREASNAARVELFQRVTWAALAAAVVVANGTALYALL